MRHYEAPESVKYHGGYDPSDPPQGEHCPECCPWDDECECPTEVPASLNEWLQQKTQVIQ